MLLKDKPIRAEFVTEKSVGDYVGCLNPKLLGLHSVQLMRDGQATVLRATNLGNTVVVVEVHPHASGARVVYRRRFTAVGADEDGAAVRGCG